MTNQFLWGALAMSTATVACFFFRFFASSRDRFFLIFGTAFLVLTVNWTGLALVDPASDGRNYLYVVRLLAFALFIVGILDKNRGRPAGGR